MKQIQKMAVIVLLLGVEQAQATPFTYSVVGTRGNDSIAFQRDGQSGNSAAVFGGTITGNTDTDDLQFVVDTGLGLVRMSILNPTTYRPDLAFNSVERATANANPGNRGTFDPIDGPVREIGVNDNCGGGVCGATGIRGGFIAQRVSIADIGGVQWATYNAAFRFAYLANGETHGNLFFGWSAPLLATGVPPVEPPGTTPPGTTPPGTTPPGTTPPGTTPPVSPPTEVPEPASLGLLGLGLAGAWKRRKAARL